MATRPVFITADKPPFFCEQLTTFKYCSGFSIVQQQRSIVNLHHAFLQSNGNGDSKILEISTKSPERLGVQLSAFNLCIFLDNDKAYPLESYYQASKVFQDNVQLFDLLTVPAREAKKDERIRNSGDIISFRPIAMNSFEFPANSNPPTFYYNWLYCFALSQNHELSRKVVEYDAFTDIAYNPAKAWSSQARAAAIYVSLYRMGKATKENIENPDQFRFLVYPDFDLTTERREDSRLKKPVNEQLKFDLNA